MNTKEYEKQKQEEKLKIKLDKLNWASKRQKERKQESTKKRQNKRVEDIKNEKKVKVLSSKKGKSQLSKTRRGRMSKGEKMTAKLWNDVRKFLIQDNDTIFSVRIKERDRVGDFVTCPLCGHVDRYDAKTCHNMHGLKRGIRKYRWRPENCNAGCMRCNVMLHGNYDVYDVRMKDHLGEKTYREMKEYQRDCRLDPSINKKPNVPELFEINCEFRIQMGLPILYNIQKALFEQNKS